ncbi:MAG: restriction endonuclease [Candidatus Thorarchaeota archaeon]
MALIEDREAQRLTLKKWLSKHARDKAVHYTDIAEALGRDPASVSASLSIERKQAQKDDRPAYFSRKGPGLYQYNELCEGAIDEDSVKEVRKRADEFNMVTRSKLNQAIAELSLDAFGKLARIILLNVRARMETIEEKDLYNNTLVLTTSWLDDGGRAPVVFHVKKCDLDEEIQKEAILELRGALQSYGANQGVLISNGIVNEEGRREALVPGVSVSPVHIMDKEIILNILIESRTGIRTKKVEVFLHDKDFFERLELME